MYNLLDEDEKSFTIEKEGKKFKVAKKSVSPKMHETIRSFCNGGKVKGYSDGGVVSDSDSNNSNLYLQPDLKQYADKYQFTPAETKAASQIYAQESQSGQADTSKENYAGAKGPMQMTRTTFDSMKQKGQIPSSFDFNNPENTKEASAILIKQLSSTPKIGQDPQKIKAAYYGGPKAVSSSGIVNFGDKLNPNAPTTLQYAQTNPFAGKDAPQVPFYQRQPNAPIDVNAATQFNPQASAINQNTSYPVLGQNQIDQQKQILMDRYDQAALNPHFPLNQVLPATENPASPDAFAKPGEQTTAQINQNLNVPKSATPMEYQKAYQDAIANQNAGVAQLQQPQQRQDQSAGYTGDLPPALQDIFNAQSNAISEKAKAEQGLASGAAGAFGSLADQQAAAQKQYQQNIIDANKAIDDYAAQYKNQKIDPNRVFANASTGDKIIGAIGLLMSGIGSGLTGQPNLALKVIDDAINRDIDAQKNDLGKGQNLLDLQLKKYGNINQAINATQLMMMNQANAKLSQSIENAKSPIIQANMKAAQAELKAKMLAVSMDLRNQMLDVKANTGFGQIKMYSPEHINLLYRNPKLAETQVYDKDKGLVYFAPDKDVRSEVTNYVSGVDDTIRTLKNLQNYSLAAKVPTSQEKAYMQSQLALAKQKYTTLESSSIGSKRLSELEGNFAKEIIPDVTSVSTFFPAKTIQSVIDSIRQSKENKLKYLLPGYQEMKFPTTNPIGG